MVGIGVLVAVAVVAGVSAWMALRRWPLLDPGAPAGAVRIVGDEVRSEATPSMVRKRLDPATGAGLGLTVGVGIVVFGGAVLAGLAFLVRSNASLLSLDRSVATWGATNATDLSTTLLRGITQLGSTTAVVVVAVIVAATRIRTRRAPTMVGFLVVVILGQNLIANLVKLGVDRVRPTIHPLAGFSGASFPSGHTTAAFATFAACALVLGRGRGPRVQAGLMGAAIGLGTAVGMSRMLLGVHWMTDVIGGCALGLAWFSISAIAFGGRLLQFGAPVEAGQRAARLADAAEENSTALTRNE